MPQPTSITEEMRIIRDVIREAHEAVKDLRNAIRDANRLAPTLTDRFREHADREIGELDNHLQAIINDQSTQLNAAVKTARDAIIKHLLITEMVLDPDTQRVSFHFPPIRFADDTPPPRPDVQPKEVTP